MAVLVHRNHEEIRMGGRTMTPPKKIYLQVCGTCQDNECDKCDFDKLQEVTWCKDQIHKTDVPYFSEEAVREAGFIILRQVSETLSSTYNIQINSAHITEDIIRLLKGGEK